MSYEITSWAWQQSGLPANAKFALLALADYADTDKGECWPSIPNMAEKMGHSRTSTKSVRAGIKVLEERGLVTVIRRKRAGTEMQTSHLYRVNWKRSGQNAPTVGANHPEGQGKTPDEPVTEPINEPITSPTPSPLRDDVEKEPSAIDVPSTARQNSSIEDTPESTHTRKLKALARNIYYSTSESDYGEATEDFINAFESIYGTSGLWDAGHMLVNNRYDERLTELVHEAQRTRGEERGLSYGVAQWLSIFTNDFKAN